MILHDEGLSDQDWLLRKIYGENWRQLLKWGFQTHSSFEWLTYTAEELGELAKAISEFEYRGGSREAIVKEAIQVATLAVKIAFMVERRTDEAETRTMPEVSPEPLENGKEGPGVEV